MIDGEVTAEDVDRLDAAWDEMNLGRAGRSPVRDPADEITLGSLREFAVVSPPIGRRIWTTAVVRSDRSHHHASPRTVSTSGRPAQLVASSAPGRGWLPAGFIAAVAALAVSGGIFFSGGDGDGVVQTLPGDASSVVATLPSAAPAWATPGGEDAPT